MAIELKVYVNADEAPLYWRISALISHCRRFGKGQSVAMNADFAHIAKP